jgi:hypothetical protein
MRRKQLNLRLSLIRRQITCFPDFIRHYILHTTLCDPKVMARADADLVATTVDAFVERIQDSPKCCRSSRYPNISIAYCVQCRQQNPHHGSSQLFKVLIVLDISYETKLVPVLESFSTSIV